MPLKKCIKRWESEALASCFVCYPPKRTVDVAQVKEPSSQCLPLNCLLWDHHNAIFAFLKATRRRRAALAKYRQASKHVAGQASCSCWMKQAWQGLNGKWESNAKKARGCLVCLAWWHVGRRRIQAICLTGCSSALNAGLSPHKFLPARK